jgi:hypothetical protein
MRQVVDKLCSSGFITCNQMEAHLSSPSNHDVTDQISGLGRWVNNVARHFTDPDGTLAKMDGWIKSLKDYQAGDSIEQGGKIFLQYRRLERYLFGCKLLRTRT